MKSPKFERVNLINQYGTAIDRMKSLVDFLNAPPIYLITKPFGPSGPPTVPIKITQMHTELRRLVNAWFESGPNLENLFEAETSLRSRALSGKTKTILSETGMGYLTWTPEVPDADLGSQEDLALTQFVMLIVNPEWELLARPCARCGNYYLKNSKAQKTYCSRTCGSKATATSAVKKRRQQEHAEMVRCVQRSIDEWEKGKIRSDWKTWVSRKTGYTKQMLTRAVTKEHLRPPLRSLYS